jgi:hypothetical protein
MTKIRILIDRWVPAAIREQKKQRRFRLGLLLPMRCPVCRQFTQQRAVRPFALKRRRCLSCTTEFTSGEGRNPQRLAARLKADAEAAAA